MAQPPESTSAVTIKAGGPDIEGDVNMENSTNPTHAANNDDTATAVGAAGPNPAAPTAPPPGVGPEAGTGGPAPQEGGIEHVLPVVRKDKNLREFLAAMDGYAPIV